MTQTSSPGRDVVLVNVLEGIWEERSDLNAKIARLKYKIRWGASEIHPKQIVHMKEQLGYMQGYEIVLRIRIDEIMGRLDDS